MLQDDTYTESYISTIGVDFVRSHFLVPQVGADMYTVLQR